MAQHAILRFEKHKGNPARPLESHHERQKEQYASNPDIDTSRSKYNFHIVKPEGRYYHFIQSRIEQAGCRTRKDSTRFVDTLITASPEFFKGKPPKEIQAFFQRAADFLIDKVGRENIVSAVVHMDEKTPHLHLVFVPLTKDNRLCAKEIIGNRANLTKWQDDFHAYMVEKYPDLERGESASKTGRKHIPTRLFKQAVNLSKQARAIEATLDGITPFNAGEKKIESQIEFCKYELKGGNCKEYTDKGYSGKNTDRPKFQELVRDIKRGLIAKVVVYKLDRISCSILDFANMMELFQQYNVEFVSSTEKFDTSTPMGRAMLNICIVFAQLERETIQKRVTDAYYSRSQRGFKMGGKAPYGFHTEPIKMDGINTKKLVVNPDEAANIRLMFEMYAQPTTSYGDINRYFAEQGILFNGKELIRPTLAQMLRNPVYVQADLDVYEFFKSQGTVIVNDAADFTGMNGCYLYQGRDVKPSKKNDLKLRKSWYHSESVMFIIINGLESVTLS